MAYVTETVGLRGTDTYTGIVDCNLNEDTPSYHWPNDERYLQTGSGIRRSVGYQITLPNKGGAVTVQNSGIWMFRVFGASYDYSLTQISRAMNASQATWDEYSSGNAWTGGGATGVGDLGSVLGTATITADVNYAFIGGTALDTLVASTLNGGGDLRILLKRTSAADTDTPFICGTNHSNASIRTYFTYDWQASGGGGGSSIAAIASYYRMLRSNT